MEALAVHDFQATVDEELSFCKGDTINVIVIEDDPNWYTAEFLGKSGLVPCNYINMRPNDWYVSGCSRLDAEKILLEKVSSSVYLQPDGAFVVRRSQIASGGFSLSVKRGEEVIHYKVLQDSKKLFFLWPTTKFKSLNQLIAHHKTHSICPAPQHLLLKDRVSSQASTNEDRDVFAEPSPTPTSSSNNPTPSNNGTSAMKSTSTPRLVRSQSIPPGSRTYGSSGLVATDSGHPPQSELEEKIASFKAWSVNTFKYTRQILNERLMNAPRTVDPDVEKRIADLRQLQIYYRELLAHVRRVIHHFSRSLAHQKSLSDLFSVMKVSELALSQQFAYNSEAQKIIFRNGEAFIASLQFFSQTLDTMVNKTMADTLLTVANYEQSRVEFDAYLRDVREVEGKLTAAAQHSGGSGTDPLGQTKLQVARQKAEKHRVKFEKLRDDVTVKMNLLDENRVRVMHNHMLLFHNSMSAFFSGNRSALAATMKQFSIKLKPLNDSAPSWLETQAAADP